MSSITSAIESYKKLLLIVKSSDYWPWKLSHDVCSAGQRSIPSRLILSRYVMKYNVFGSRFFTNLPAAKATENSAKYTNVNKVEVMTFSAITFLKEGRATQIYIMEKLFDSRTMGRCYAAKCNIKVKCKINAKCSNL